MELKIILNQIISSTINEYPATIDQLKLSNEITSEAVFDPYNQRIKFHGLTASAIAADTIEILKSSAHNSKICFSKIMVYAYPGEETTWRNHGFVAEGIIRCFFADHADAHIWSLFLDPKRFQGSSNQADRNNDYASFLASLPKLPSDLSCHTATAQDAFDISALLMETFPDYPSSITAKHIQKQIISQSNYFRFIRNHENKIIAVMSAEIDHKRASAEMTDCATAPAYRGKGLMYYLLYKLELDLKTRLNITDFYTLSRAANPAINRVFAKSNYSYTGRLINNCRMPNGWETMNIWCKNI